VDNGERTRVLSTLRERGEYVDPIADAQ
jgi:hypothetical protein